MCIHVPSGAALQEPAGGGPHTRREHRRGARARVSADAAAAAAAAVAAEVHVTEKLQVLEVCVCLKVHRKGLRKVHRQDRHPEQLSQEYKFINNSNNSNKPNNCNKNTDSLTFK